MAKMLKGGKVLARRFAALGRHARGADLRAAVVAGGTVIQEEAARLAPETDVPDPIVMSDVEIGGNRASVDIGYDKDGAWYLSFAETGTKLQRAQPHLRPAIDRHQVVIDAVGRPLRAGIDVARRA